MFYLVVESGSGGERRAGFAARRRLELYERVEEKQKLIDVRDVKEKGGKYVETSESKLHLGFLDLLLLFRRSFFLSGGLFLRFQFLKEGKGVTPLSRPRGNRTKLVEVPLDR